MAGTKGDGGRSGDAYPLRLFLSLRADLTRYVRTIAADGDDVDDIVQEAWCRFSAAAPSQAIQEPRGFLFRIARNLAMDGHRRRQTERKLFASEASEVTSLVPSDEPSAQAQVEAVDELAAVRAAMSRHCKPARASTSRDFRPRSAPMPMAFGPISTPPFLAASSPLLP
jgi:DNA-directed RNA polymerase specialized sigma24 family protein